MSFTPVESVGVVQRRKREKLGLSVRRVAAAMAASHVYLLDLEAGNRFFSDALRKRNNAALRALKKINPTSAPKR